jgi:succinate dehydrogenase hydrophobic anchor subunit
MADQSIFGVNIHCLVGDTHDHAVDIVTLNAGGQEEKSENRESLSRRQPHSLLTGEKHKIRLKTVRRYVDAISFSNRMHIMAPATASPVPSRSFSRNPVRALYQSSIGKKFAVAVTGIILIVFVIGHLLGNLEIYLGQDHTNWYAEFLRSTGPLLWIVRITLILAVCIHIVATIQLAVENRRAKPKKYAVTKPRPSLRGR